MFAQTTGKVTFFICRVDGGSAFRASHGCRWTHEVANVVVATVKLVVSEGHRIEPKLIERVGNLLASLHIALLAPAQS